jgi:hypothetical protein
MKETSSPTRNNGHVSEEESRRVAEAARETKWDKPGFLRELFLGKLHLDLVHPFPDPKGIHRPEFREFYTKMKELLEKVDSDAIDRDGKIPPEVINRLAEMGQRSDEIARQA